MCVTITRKEALERFSHLPRLHTALHAAACEGQNEMVLALLRKGADREALDDEKRTPLIVAACGDRLPVAETLLDADRPLRSEFRRSAYSAWPRRLSRTSSNNTSYPWSGRGRERS